MSKNSTVFHYCSMDKFCSIIKSATIRFSNIQNMNDSLEWEWIKRILENILTQNGFNLSGKTATVYQQEVVLQDIMGKHLYNADQLLYPNIYAMCFSTNGDMLSQWRGYGNDGAGVSIGFNKELLESFEYIDCNEIIYNKTCQRAMIEDIIEHSLSLESTILSCVEEDASRENALRLLQFEEDDFRDMLSNILEYAPFFKSPAFSEEKEWRILCNKFYLTDRDESEFSFQNGSEESNGLKLSYIDFDICGNGVTDYFVLDFRKRLDSIIQKIVIGPKCKLSEEDIFRFLTQYGYRISKSKITKSKSSYR